jgi:hypothetical protein
VLEARGTGQRGIRGRRNNAMLGSAPCSSASASRARQGMCATPPRQMRACRMRLPSMSSAAATDTSAKA